MLRSHTYEQQIITTECLLDSINDGGVLLIEDTHTSYIDGFGPKSKSFIEYVKERIDTVNYRYERFSDKAAVQRVEKLQRAFKFLESVPYAKKTGVLLKNFMVNRKFSASKYFR